MSKVFTRRESSSKKDEMKEDMIAPPVRRLSSQKSLESRLSTTSLNSVQLQAIMDENACPPSPTPSSTMGSLSEGCSMDSPSMSPSSRKSESNINQITMFNKMEALIDRIRQTEIDLSGEKALRKKKEKNLMKLALELKKRNQQREEDRELVKEMANKTKELALQLSLAKQELAQIEQVHEVQLENKKRAYEAALAQSRAMYEKALRDHDKRVGQLNKAHAQQCEQLCREILKSNLEADDLQTDLAKKRGTLFDMKPRSSSSSLSSLNSQQPFTKQYKQKKNGIHKIHLRTLLVALSIFVCAVAVVGVKVNSYNKSLQEVPKKRFLFFNINED